MGGVVTQQKERRRSICISCNHVLIVLAFVGPIFFLESKIRDKKFEVDNHFEVGRDLTNMVQKKFAASTFYFLT